MQRREMMLNGRRSPSLPFFLWRVRHGTCLVWTGGSMDPYLRGVSVITMTRIPVFGALHCRNSPGSVYRPRGTTITRTGMRVIEKATSHQAPHLATIRWYLRTKSRHDKTPQNV